MHRGPEEAPPQTRRDPNVLISLVASTATATLALTAVDVWHVVRTSPWAAAHVPRPDAHSPARLDRGLRPWIVQLRRRGPAGARLHLRPRLGDGRGRADGHRQPRRPPRPPEPWRLRRRAVLARRGRRNRLLRRDRGRQVVGGRADPPVARRGGDLHARQRRPALPRDQPGRRREPVRRLARALPVADPVLHRRRPARARAGGRLRAGRPDRPAGVHAPARDDDVLDAAVRLAHAAVRRGGARRERGAAGRERPARGAQRRPPGPVPVRRRPRLARARPHVADRLRRGGAFTLTGTQAEIALGEGEGGIGLVAGGSRIGGLHLAQTPGFEGERWDRLREAILPQLATAIESASLVEQERKLRLATIAALARSMEAKDYYTGGHTERVSEVAVALASGSATRASSSTRSRSAPSCTTSARSGSPSASSTSPARSTTRSGR